MTRSIDNGGLLTATIGLILLLQIWHIQDVGCEVSTAPSNHLRVVSKKYEQLMVSWDPGTGTTQPDCNELFSDQECSCTDDHSNSTCDIDSSISGLPINITLTSLCTDGCTIVILSVPGPPHDLHLKSISSTQVRLIWSAPQALHNFNHSYNVSYDSRYELVDSSNTSVLLTDLEGDKNYNISIYTIVKSGNEIETSTTVPIPVLTVPSPVTGLRSLAFGQTWVQLEWDNRTGNIKCYTISYKNMGFADQNGSSEAEDDSVITSDNSNSFNLTTLHEYTTYSFTVFGTNAAGNGEVSNVAQANTTIGEPLEVTKIQVSSTHSSIIVTWTKPTRRTGPTDYRIEATTQGIPTIITVNGFNATGGTVLKLKPYTNYIVIVYTRVNGMEEPSEGKYCLTDEYGPSRVTGLKALKLDQKWVELQWDEPATANGIIRNYTISYKNMGFADHQGSPDFDDASVQTSNNDTRFNITGLHEYTTYNFTVFGTTDGGNGEASEAIQNNTKVGDPVPVIGIDIKTSKTTIYVKWSKLARRTGPTTFYIEAMNNATRTVSTVHGFNKTGGNVSGLNSYINYTITVVTEVDGRNASSNGTVVNTDQDAPVAVQNITTTSTSTSITVTWVPGNRTGVTEYQVRAQSVDKDHNISCLGYTCNTTVFMDIEPYRNYTITVYTIVDTMIAISDSVVETTEQAVALQVYDVIAYGPFMPKELYISWTVPTPRQGPTEYNVSAIDLDFGDPVTDVTIAGFNHSSAKLKGLKPFRTYNVSVTTFVNTSSGVLSSLPVYSANNYTTLEDRPSGNLKVEVKDNATVCPSMDVNWLPLSNKSRNGVIQNYTIKVKDYSNQINHVVQADQLKEETSQWYNETLKLTPGVMYTIEVYPSNDVGKGKSTDTTKKALYCPPPFPPESPTNETKVIQPASGTKLHQTRLEIIIDAKFFTNTGGGYITDRFLIIAQVQAVGKDPLGGNATSINSRNLAYDYPQTSLNEDGKPNTGPFRLFLKAELFEDTYRTFKTDKFTFEIGTGDECEDRLSSGQQAAKCNGELKDNEKYKIRAVSCTEGGCTLTSYSATVQTIAYGPACNHGCVALAVIIPLFLFIVGGLIFFMRHQELGPFSPKPTTPIDPRSRQHGNANGAFTMDAIQPNAAKRTRFGFRRNRMAVSVEKPRPVPLEDFTKHVTIRHRNSDLLFSEEYKLLKEISQRMTWNAAELPENRNKNRYNNILPYDHSRVKLLSSEDDEDSGSDFINANYMPGYNSKREFIASQGPLAGTKDDFWRLIWEQKVSLVVMVTKCLEKGRHKCEQYWPNDREPLFYGDLQVTVRSESVLNNYTIRILDISMGATTRTVHHFNFVMWPDFGCPETTEALLEFVLTVKMHSRGQQLNPTVIHCSAGVGRTGTFITVDRLLQHMRDHDTVDVFGTILEMRRYRTNMVQTEDQYIYIHDCLRDALAQGFHKRYPTNTPQPPPVIEHPTTNDEKEEQPLYENWEPTIPRTEITDNNNHIGTGNNTDEKEEQPLYENWELTIPHTEITDNNHIGTGNNTGL